MHFAAAVYINLRRDMCGYYHFVSPLQRSYVAAPSSLGVTQLLRRPAVGNDVTPPAPATRARNYNIFVSLIYSQEVACPCMFAPRTGVSFLSPEENSVSAVVQTRKRGNLCFSLARMYNYSPPLGGHPACSGICSIMAGMPPPPTASHL